MTAILLVLFAIFCFYTLNYRSLIIRLWPQALELRFGIFRWAVPLNQVASYRLDEIPALMRLGGAGIHFMFIQKRYRASWNFLEYPRLVITFKERQGLVRDLSFSTSRPEDLLKLLEATVEMANIR